VTLSEELKLYNSEMEPDEFNDTLQETHTTIAPNLNAEQLMYYPTEFAAPLCRAIRAKAGRRLPDEMILRRLNNLRKNGSDSGTK
jgi:hypothetical protein